MGEGGELVSTKTKEARTWAMLCHLGGLGIYIIPTIGHLIFPLLIWAIKKDKHPFVDEHGKAAINFQLSFTIYAVISLFLTPIFGLGIVLLIALALFDLIVIIVAAVKANSGEYYQYPFSIRFIRMSSLLM